MPRTWRVDLPVNDVVPRLSGGSFRPHQTDHPLASRASASGVTRALSRLAYNPGQCPSWFWTAASSGAEYETAGSLIPRAHEETQHVPEHQGDGREKRQRRGDVSVLREVVDDVRCVVENHGTGDADHRDREPGPKMKSE